MTVRAIDTLRFPRENLLSPAACPSAVCAFWICGPVTVFEAETADIWLVDNRFTLELYLSLSLHQSRDPEDPASSSFHQSRVEFSEADLSKFDLSSYAIPSPSLLPSLEDLDY